MLAALHGRILNASQLGTALALDSKTVAGYCDYLEGAFLIRRLQPYHANIHKRIVKSSKVFWRDSGLLNYLLGTHDMEELFSQPWVGHAWEGFVIRMCHYCYNCGKSVNCGAWKTLDLLKDSINA